MTATFKISLFFCVCILIACQTKESQNDTALQTKPAIDYPTNLTKIFDAHGGLAKWKEQKSMSYEIVKATNEKQWIDLEDRRERIEGENVTMGYDGSNFWMEADTSYKGNPIFYKNLMFYFYAMPFVVADEGIIYNNVPALDFEGVSYPGIRISYNAGIGVSPKDEYFIHYNPKTHNMEWLGYTVTYRTKEKSDNIKWIRYADWHDVNGLRLPKTLSWFKNEDNKPLELRNKVDFVNVNMSPDKFEDQQFAKTKLATIVTE